MCCLDVVLIFSIIWFVTGFIFGNDRSILTVEGFLISIWVTFLKCETAETVETAETSLTNEIVVTAEFIVMAEFLIMVKW